jgi:hypothetical protein
VEGGTTIRGFDAGLYLDNAHIDFPAADLRPGGRNSADPGTLTTTARASATPGSPPTVAAAPAARSDASARRRAPVSALNRDHTVGRAQRQPFHVVARAVMRDFVSQKGVWAATVSRPLATTSACPRLGTKPGSNATLNGRFSAVITT